MSSEHQERRSRRLEKKNFKPKSTYIVQEVEVFPQEEEDEEIEIGSEDTTSTGETDPEDETDSSSDYEPEKDEALSSDPEEREKEEALNEGLLARERERQIKKLSKKKAVTNTCNE